MKKSLIALAVLAASGTAFAQSSVTLSGKFGVAYQKGLSGNTANKANLGVTDGDVTFAAVEDMGGGNSAGASMTLRVRGRGNVDAQCSVTIPTTLPTTATTTNCNSGVGGRDATVFVAGALGRLTLGSIELGNGIKGRGWGGANVSLPTDLDNGGILSAAANADYAAWALPTFVPGVSTTILRVDGIGEPGNTATTRLAGTALVLGYKAGPLDVGIDFTKFDHESATAAGADRKRVRTSASYDLGVVKLGVGMEDNKGTAGGTNYDGRQTTAGFSVPMGAVTAGLVYAKNDEKSTLGGTDTAKGWGLGVDYKLSARSVVNFSYGDITRTTATAAGSMFRVRLMHSF